MNTTEMKLSHFLTKTIIEIFLILIFGTKNYTSMIIQKIKMMILKNLFLTKNNYTKNFKLKKYFVSNFDYFSEKNKKIIIDNYN